MIRALHATRLLTLGLMLAMSLSCGGKESEQPARASDTTTQQAEEETAHKDDHDEAETR